MATNQEREIGGQKLLLVREYLRRANAYLEVSDQAPAQLDLWNAIQELDSFIAMAEAEQNEQEFIEAQKRSLDGAATKTEDQGQARPAEIQRTGL
jgi:hypothetical protein